MSSKEWSKHKLGEIANVQTGPFGSQLHQKDYVLFGTPIITVEHLGENHLLHENLPRVSDADKHRLNKYTLKEGDIVFSRVGSVDRRALVKKDEEGWLFSGRCLRVRPTTKELNAEYLSYYFGLDTFKKHIRAIAVGSTMPSLNTTILSEIEIPFPPLPTQRRIADILSALDEKIELNRQVNVTLEAMAQAIFREWFVEFNLPAIGVGADLKSAPTEPTNTLPQGWRVGKLGEIYKTASGGTPSRARNEYYENGTYQWVKSKELNGSFIVDTEEKITDDALKNSSAKLLPKHSVLVAMYGATVGEIGIISNEATTNQAVCAFIPNGDYPFSFIFQFLKNNKDDIISRAVGSAQQNISQELLKNLEVIIPESNLLKKYHTVVEPIFLAIEENIKQTAILAAVRDALLPKLMSGEIGV